MSSTLHIPNDVWKMIIEYCHENEKNKSWISVNSGRLGVASNYYNLKAAHRVYVKNKTLNISFPGQDIVITNKQTARDVINYLGLNNEILNDFL